MAEILNKELIQNPRLWRLELRIERSMLHVLLFNSIEDNSLIYRKIELDESQPSHLKALENAIYENPLLLSDFDRIDCVIDTNTFVVIPAEINDESLRQQILETSFPEFKGEMIVCDLNNVGASILMGVETDVLRFLRRTFNNPRLHHHLAPLAQYFFHKSKLGNNAKMYAVLRKQHIDLFAFADRALKLANTFTYRDPLDAVYYILSCRKQLQMSPTNDELFITGSTTTRETITPILRKHLSFVMPVIFPSEMFKAGKEAMKAPFDLIVIPLCE